MLASCHGDVCQCLVMALTESVIRQCCAVRRGENYVGGEQ